MQNSAYQIITDRIIALLERGTVPWQQPWNSVSGHPRNLVSRREYRGVNVFLLHALRYESPFWLTWKQAIQLGGTVRKGEKACPVVFWRPVPEKDTVTGKEEQRLILRYYSVFNAAQCDGIERHVPSFAPVENPPDPITAAEAIVDRMPHRPVIEHGYDRACYSPAADVVRVPPLDRFVKGEEYYSTLFHELTHATGHVSRLNRKEITEGHRFGSAPYSKEELVAEMGSAFLCGQAGIVERTLDNSAAYIQCWLDRLKKDVRLVVNAAAHAQRAADYIMDVSTKECEATHD